MKLYVEKLTPLSVNNDLIKDYLYKTIDKKLLFSPSGIFNISNNKIYKIHINDNRVDTFNIGNFKCILDYSTICDNKDEYYQIPYNNYLYNYKKLLYRLRDKSSTIFIIELYDNSIIDCYFDIKEYNSIADDDINAFLATLTFI